MRKFLKIQLIAATLLTASLSLSSCQKEQESADEPVGINDVVRISSQEVNATNIRGLISKETAESMSQTFNQTFKTSNSTEYVAFGLNDMDNYLQMLKAKYKSDSVYVSFGVYDEKTAINQKDVGRITVFFMGKNNKTTSGNIRSQETPGDSVSNYLNHGSIWP